MAGCSASKNIVAINRDEDANIFKSAAYGVVGDWNKVLPSFIETVREAQGQLAAVFTAEGMLYGRQLPVRHQGRDREHWGKRR